MWFEPVTKTIQSANTTTGNGQIFDLNGKYGALTAQVVISATATVTFEASQDGTNYVAIRGINKNSGAGATTATASGIFTFAVTGIKKFRARISAYTSGTVTVTATAVPASEPANQATTTTGTVAIDQTTAGATNNVTAEGKAAHDAAASGAPVQVGGVYRVTDPAVADGDMASLRVNAKGEALVSLTRTTINTANRKIGTVTIASGADAIIWTPNAGKKINLYHLFLAVDTGTASITVKAFDTSNVAVFEIAKVIITARSENILPYDYGYQTTTADYKLGVTNTGGASINLIYTTFGGEVS